MEGELLCADRILGLGDLVEEPGSLVDAVLTDVNVAFDGADGPPLAEGRVVHHPALTPDGVEGQDLVERDPEDLVPEELPVRFVEGLVRTQVVMPEREPLALFVDPEPFDSEDVHVVGRDLWVDGFEGGVVALGQRGRLHRRTDRRIHHLVRDSSVRKAKSLIVSLSFVVFWILFSNLLGFLCRRRRR